MTSLQAIAALKDKKAALIKQIRHGEKQLRALRADLAHIDGVLNLFSPESVRRDDKGRPVLSIKGYYGYKEIPVLCLETLKATGKPMTARALAMALIARKRLPANDPAIFNMTRIRLLQYLRTAHKRGLMARTMTKRGAEWEIAA